MLQIYLKRVEMFFDRPAVLKAMDKARVRSFAIAGGFIRQTARRSMRRRKTASPPGSPPSARSGELRDRLYFGYDKSTDSVVVGPEGFRGSGVPALHERGGTIRRKRRRGSRRPGGSSVEETITVTYPPRPFMDPALHVAIAKGKIPEAFRDSIRST